MLMYQLTTSVQMFVFCGFSICSGQAGLLVSCSDRRPIDTHKMVMTYIETLKQKPGTNNMTNNLIMSQCFSDHPRPYSSRGNMSYTSSEGP